MDGVSFAGNGGMDLSVNVPADKSYGMTSGGPLVSPKGCDQGMTAPENVTNYDGDVPMGGSIESPVSEW